MKAAFRLNPSPVGSICSHGTKSHSYVVGVGGETLPCSQRSGVHHVGGVWTTDKITAGRKGHEQNQLRFADCDSDWEGTLK